MTTKFLDYKICTLKILLSWRCPPPPPKKKTMFWTIFLSAPNDPSPLKTANFIFIVVSLPLTTEMRKNFSGQIRENIRQLEKFDPPLGSFEPIFRIWSKIAFLAFFFFCLLGYFRLLQLILKAIFLGEKQNSNRLLTNSLF